MPPPEPWLRGRLPDTNPLLAPALRALEQVLEDLPRFTGGLTTAQLWTSPGACAPAGFHLQHIAGSVDRLATYLRGAALDDAQLAALAGEQHPGAEAEEMVAAATRAISAAMEQIRQLPESEFTATRFVGRARVPVTALGLAFHIAEHTQRHMGQLIVLSRLACA